MLVELEILCMSLSEVKRIDTSGAFLREWAGLADKVWGEDPFYEVMSLEERIITYGEKLGVHGRVCFAKIKGKLVGYSWGYPVDEEELQEISHGTTELKQYFGGVQTVWYVDAVGVLEEFRGQGIGPLLFGCLMRVVLTFGFTYIFFRTEVDTVRKKMGEEWGFEDTHIFDGYYTKRNYYVLAP